jgi:D-alanyl-D-alanine carboxypeptidase
MLERARRLFASLALAAATAIAPVAATSAQAQIPYTELSASEPKYAAIVVDATSGEVLYAKRADSPRYPASITKVMTLYLAFEALAAGRIKLDDPVVVSPRAAAQAPTKLGLKAGESLTVEQAMLALATKSANDIAVALAETLGGTESRFAAMMTLRARELGMTQTRFVNASGLPDSRQISTARDLAILSRAVMRDYPQYYSLFSTRNFTFRGTSMRNHNGMLSSVPGVDGIKTGYTNASGYNIAVSAVRDNRRLITVVLGAPSTAARNQNAEQLLLTGFNVINRRNNGEVITVAQTIFEPEPMNAISRPSYQQGDSDIQLTSAPAPEAAPRPKAEGAARGGAWIVQVGAFKSKADASEQLGFVTKRFGPHVANAKRLPPDKLGGTYRARFTGFTEASAKQACSAMKAKRLDCMVVRPG